MTPAPSWPWKKKDFLKTLNKSEYAEQRAQWQALASARPKLLVVPDESARHVRQPLAVPDLRSGSIFFRDSQTADFYYFPQLHHYMGGNFGVEKGMSGGGVVLPGGSCYRGGVCQLKQSGPHYGV